MKLSVSCTLADGRMAVSVAGPIPASEVRYFYTLCTQDGSALHPMPEPQGPQTCFDLGVLGCPGGGYYVDIRVEYRDTPAEPWTEAHAKSPVVFYYQTRRLSYEALESSCFTPGELTLYEIAYQGVVFEFLLHLVPDSRQLAVFGNGNIHKSAQLPIFHRMSWYTQLPCSGLWYFDPSLYLGEARLCWGYGTAQRWYLAAIAQILKKITVLLGIEGNDLVFYGSSGGGFMSLILACLLRGKADVLNPQFFPLSYHPHLVQAMEDTCLGEGEQLDEARLNPVELFRREGFVPYIHCTQNSSAEDDIYGQLLPFLDALKKAFPRESHLVEVSWFYAEKGHNSWPAPSTCIQGIRNTLGHRDSRLGGGAGEPAAAPAFTADCTAQGDTLSVTVHPLTGSLPARYACYLLDNHKTVLQKLPYQRERVFSFSVPPGAYQARVFARARPKKEEPPVIASQYTQPVFVHAEKELDYHALDETDFHSEQLIYYRVYWDEMEFQLAVRCPPEADRAVVLSSGDVLCDEGAPFHRLSWAEEIPGCAIYYRDPTLAHGESTLDWGYGTGERWYLEYIAVLIKKILDSLGIALSDTLFFGASGGGFMSILLAAMLRGRATAINPHLALAHVWPTQLERFRASVLKPGEALLPHRTRALSLIEREDFFPPLQIVQNRTDSWGISRQLTPFLAELPGLDASPGKNLRVQFYDIGGGCGALPPKEDCLALMAQALARPEPCLDEPSPCPPGSLLARLAEGEFDGGAGKSPALCDFSGPPIPRPIPAVADEQVMSCARDLLAGKLWVYHRIAPMDYDLDTLDFTTRFSRIPNSFQLYLQGLNPIQILTAAYKQSGDVAYLAFAGRFLEGWKVYAVAPEAKQNPYAFQNGHVQSLRAENLMYWGQSCARAGIPTDGLYELLARHGAWLRDAHNYHSTHNHGMMENLALLHLGYVLRRPEWVTCAKKRLVNYWETAFDREYVHRENSPAYADMVIDLFQRAGRYLVARGDSLGQRLLADISCAQEFMRWVVKPDGSMAQIGDTPAAPPRETIEAGPPSGRRLFQPSGYFFCRSADGGQQDTWKMLKAGFDNLTHKHADDGSFMLYARGQDVFVDCGMYGYVKDEYQNYVRSANAHNMVVVDDGSYPLTPAAMSLVGIQGHRFLPAYDWVDVFNRAYEGVSIRRRFLSSGDATILIDWVESQAEHTYSQLFHLGELVEVLFASDSEVLLRLAKRGCTVRLRQLGTPSRLSLIQGSLDRPGYGLLSRGENHLAVCQTLKFDLVGTEARWITAITIEAEDGSVLLQDGSSVPACEISYDQSKNSILLGHTAIPL